MPVGAPPILASVGPLSASLKEQALAWNSTQVSVFFRSLGLFHLIPRVVAYGVRGVDLLESPLEEVVRVLALLSDDKDSLKNVIAILDKGRDPSSPAVRSSAAPSHQTRRPTKTGIVYDARFALHKADDSTHVECPGRVTRIDKLMRQRGLYDRCDRVDAREATTAELLTTHSHDHVATIDATTNLADNEQVNMDMDTYATSRSSEAARFSIGGLIDLMQAVCNRELKNGFAIIRPPGHHAEAVAAQGFCLYNNVAVAVKALAPRKLKIAVVDFDVHAGNGTQSIFYDDPNVLLCSIHQHERGRFYPYTGRAEECGNPDIPKSLGKTINVPLNVLFCGDTEYIEIFETLLLPVLGEFKPELIVVSAGFDAAHGDPVGKMSVTSKGYGQMTRLLLKAMPHGKVVMALEGGYNLDALSSGVIACVEALLGDDHDASSSVPVEAAAAAAATTQTSGKNKNKKRKLVSGPSPGPVPLSPHNANLFHLDLLHCIRLQQRYWKCLEEVDLTRLEATENLANVLWKEPVIPPKLVSVNWTTPVKQRWKFISPPMLNSHAEMDAQHKEARNPDAVDLRWGHSDFVAQQCLIDTDFPLHAVKAQVKAAFRLGLGLANEGLPLAAAWFCVPHFGIAYFQASNDVEEEPAEDEDDDDDDASATIVSGTSAMCI